MNYEQFKAQLILDYIKDNGVYPSDDILIEIKKFADFAYLGA